MNKKLEKYFDLTAEELQTLKLLMVKIGDYEVAAYIREAQKLHEEIQKLIT